MGGWSTKEARDAWRAKNRDKEREQWMAWRARNPEKARASWRKTAAKIAATPEGKAKIIARNAEYRKNNRKKLNGTQYAYWSKPENKERKLTRRRELYKTDLDTSRAKRLEYYKKCSSSSMFLLHRRISSNVRQSLTKGKLGVRTYELLGYTKEQLASHLERQFMPKMGWHNISEWHIDHIVPLASFKFDTADDPDFKAAWALTNLRPVWAAINLRKNARRELLL